MLLRRFLTAGLPVLALMGIGGLLVLFAVRAFHERHLMVDDAYILARYASHLSEGHGFRWNVSSPPVEGFTSPLFVVLQAGLLRLGIDPPEAAALLSIAAITGVVAFLVMSAGPRRRGFAIALIPTAVLLLDPGIGTHASRGLETSVFFLVAVALVIVTGTFARAPSRMLVNLMALVSFLLVLARPDGAIIVGLCWVAAALALRRRAEHTAVLLSGAAILGMVGAAYAAWKLWYFGELLPTAYYLKAAGVGWAGGPDVSAFVAAYWGWLLAGVVAFLSTVTLASGRERANHLEALIPMVVTVCWLTYAMTIVHEMGFAHRFSFVLVPLAALAVTRGLRAALDRALERWPSSARLATGVGYLALIAVAVFAAGPVSHSAGALRSPADQGPFITEFTRIGRAISSAGLGERISYLSAIAGAAPYFAGARHTDALGLATPEFSRVTSLAAHQKIVVDSAFDVIEVPYPAASPGATSVADEPLRHTDHWRRVESHGLSYLRFRNVRDMEEYFELVHWMMRYLRDHTTPVGVVQMQDVQMRFYVLRASPHYEHLVTTLSRELASPAPPTEQTRE